MDDLRTGGPGGWIGRILLLVGVGLVAAGVLGGEAWEVWSRARDLCLECMGLR